MSYFGTVERDAKGRIGYAEQVARRLAARNVA